MIWLERTAGHNPRNKGWRRLARQGGNDVELTVGICPLRNLHTSSIPLMLQTGEIAYQNLCILSVFSYFITFCEIRRQNAWKIDPSVLPDTSIPFQTWYSPIAALRNAGRSPRTGAQVDGRSSIGSLQTLERSYNMRAGSCRKRSSHGTQGFRQRAFQSRRI